MTVNSATLEPLPLPFRLRTALGVLLVLVVGLVAVPRARAALRLLGLVNKYADFGLCMAGPTGAVALREQPAQFRVLVRRRLVGAGADERPFANCGKFYSELSGRDVPGFAVRAAEFLEWGGASAPHSLNELTNDLPDLEALAEQARPFSRKSLTELIVPSLGAKEAIHPAEPAVPGSLAGLDVRGAVVKSWVDSPRGGILMLSSGEQPWAFRSRDGRVWSRTSAWQAAVDGHANRCVAGGSGLAYSVGAGVGRPTILLADGFSESPRRIELGAEGDRVSSLACDETGAVVLTRGKTQPRIYSCPGGASGCRELTLPEFGRLRDTAIDVARVARTIVVAMSKDGLVRVVTTRDEGATMTPLTLVFDAKESRSGALGARVNVALLPLGKRLLLQLTSAQAPQGSRDSFALLSEDYGASFRGI